MGPLIPVGSPHGPSLPLPLPPPPWLLLLQPSPYMVLARRAEPNGVIFGITSECTVAVKLPHPSERRSMSVESEDSTAIDHKHQSPVVEGVAQGPCIAACADD
jgi:hypothetical protein